jgi:hypothetical protein
MKNPMNNNPTLDSQSRGNARKARKSARSRARQIAAAGGAMSALCAAQAQQAIVAPAANPDDKLTTAVSVAAKESYDSNVYMQSQGPTANRGSLVTSFIPSFGLKWRPSEAFWLDGSYAPELSMYTSDHSEDNVAHKAALNLGGKIGEGKWETDNSINWVEGNSQGPTYYWTGKTPGITPVPALGGVPLRDRRDQVVYRDTLKFEQPIGDWFLRPIGTAFAQNFMTQNRATTSATVAGTTAYYADYVDRDDINAGLDAGYKIMDKLDIYAGYRYGFQNQSQVRDTAAFPSFSNNYQRALAGVEGEPVKWLKLSAAIGPDFRDFTGAYIPASFEKHVTKLYFDASATAMAGEADKITLATKRYELPGYLGKSMLDDTTLDLAWRHAFTSSFSTSIGFKLEEWNFNSPLRDEWWYGGFASANYAFTKSLSAEASYSYDQVVSGVSNLGTANWQATRHLASLGVKYKF